jgi:ParB family chromosome partitioning protein
MVAGERRIRAARRASLTVLPALVRELSAAEAAYITAIENLQREDLDLEDEARQYQALLAATGLSQRALADQLGVSHNYIAERVRLLARPDLLTAYRAGTLTLRAVIQAERTPPRPL